MFYATEPAERPLYDEVEAAAFLGVAPGTLQVWRSTGKYEIAFIKVGSRVRYRRSVLEAWLESRTRTNGATDTQKLSNETGKRPRGRPRKVQPAEAA